MSRFRRRGLVAAVCLAVGLFAAPVAAIDHFTETFDTTGFMDAAETTADWNTGDGHLTLFPYQPAEVGSYGTGGSAREVVVAGDVAYVACWDAGLVVLDISDPSLPASIGAMALPGYATDLALAGDVLYVCCYSAGLQVVDVSDPSVPSVIGSYVPGSNAMGLDVAGDLLYLAAYDYGLVVLDVTNPAVPVFLSRLGTLYLANHVDVEGDTAYLAARYAGVDGLQVVDVSDPAAPAHLGTGAITSLAQGTAIDGHRAYVAAGADGLVVFDVSDPANPTQLDVADTDVYAYDVEVDGRYAYLADGAGGLKVFDVRNPASIVERNVVATPANAGGVAVAGAAAYVAAWGSGLRVVAIADPVDIGLSDEYAEAEVSRGYRDVVVSGDYTYVTRATQNQGDILTFSTGDPGHLYLLGSFPMNYEFFGLDLSGDLMAVGLDVGFYMIEVDGLTITPLGGLPTTGEVHEVRIAGDHLYCTDTVDGLLVFAIADPATPVAVGSESVPGEAVALDLAGDHAFVAAGAGGLRVVDIGDPAAPALVGSLLPGSGEVRDIAVAGDLAYAVGDHLWVVDVRDPTSPSMIAVENYVDGRAIVVRGDCAYVRSGDDLLRYDISDPTDPSLAGSANCGDGGTGLAVCDDFALTTGWGLAYEGQGMLQTFQVGERRRDLENDAGQSSTVATTLAPISMYRIQAGAATGQAEFWLSADGGQTWDQVLSETWVVPATPGTDLRWRAWIDIDPAWPFYLPRIRTVNVDWVVAQPVLTELADVGNDQGRQMTLTWDAGGWDDVDSQHPITGYAVYRRIDELPRAPDGDEPRPAYPPGDWHYLTTVPAFGERMYSVVVPTLADSTISDGMHWSSFFIRAATADPLTFFDSPPDSGWSTDDLAPNAPGEFEVAYATAGNALSWLESEAADFRYFKIYRGAAPDFVPDPQDPLHVTTAVAWTDPAGGFDVFYKVSAVDFAGNESPAAGPDGLTGVAAPPARFALHPNAPNPFNPRTVMRFDLPGAAAVTLRIYDVSGRRVRTLLDAAPYPGGRHAVAWEGRDDAGRAVSAGAYFCRIEAGAQVAVRRMMLVK